MEWQRIGPEHRNGKRMLVAWKRGSTAAFPNPVGAIWSGLSPDDPLGSWALDTGQSARGSYAPTHCRPIPEAPEGE